MDISDYREHIKNMRANNIRNYINRSNANASGKSHMHGGVAGVRSMDSLPKPMQGIIQPSLSSAPSELGNSLSGMGIVRKPVRNLTVNARIRDEGAGFKLPKMPKIPKSVSKVADKLLEKGAKELGKTSSKSFENFMSQQFDDNSGGKMRRPRLKSDRGGKFNFVKAIKQVGHDVGKPFSAVGVNPFDLGYTIGHDYVSPYVVDPLKKDMGGKINMQTFIPTKNASKMAKIGMHAVGGKAKSTKGGKVNFKKVGNYFKNVHNDEDLINTVANVAQAMGGEMKKKRKPSQSNMMLSHLMKQGYSMRDSWAIIKSQNRE